MTVQEAQDLLYEALNEALDEISEKEDRNVVLYTFEEQGVMTYNKGVVLGIGDSEFQISIVRSR